MFSSIKDYRVRGSTGLTTTEHDRCTRRLGKEQVKKQGCQQNIECQQRDLPSNKQHLVQITQQENHQCTK